MFTEILAYLRNYFCTLDDVHRGKFTISGGDIAPSDFLKPGQYFRVLGSALNDGVHKHPATLQDEEFTGEVWALKIPPALVTLCDRITDFAAKNPAGAFVSESFAGYSYSRATGKDGAAAGWREVYKKDLAPYRKLQWRF